MATKKLVAKVFDMENWPLKSIFDLPAVFASKAKITLVSRSDRSKVEIPLKDIQLLGSEEYDCYWEARNPEVLAKTLHSMALKGKGNLESLKVLKNGSVQCKIIFDSNEERPVRRILKRKKS